MNKKFLWIIALISPLMVNQMVFADPLVCRGGISKMVQSLNLDATQKAKIKPIVDQLKSNLKATESQMKGFEEQFIQQVSSTNMDQSKVDGLVDQKTKLIGDLMKSKLKATNQIFSLLNADQKTKLQGMIKAEDEKMAAQYKKCEGD